MDFDKKRQLARDAGFYILLRDTLQKYCQTHNLGRYDVYFSNLLGYTSKSGSMQFSSSIQDVDYRKFSVDELRLIINELGLDALPFLNRLVSDANLEVSSALPTFCFNHIVLSDLAIDGFSAMSSFFDTVKNAFADNKLSKEEQKELLIKFDDLHSFLISLGVSLNDSLKSTDTTQS